MIVDIYFQPKLANQQRCSVYQLTMNVLQYKQWYECRVVIQYKQWYDRGLPYLAACYTWYFFEKCRTSILLDRPKASFQSFENEAILFMFPIYCNNGFV